MNHKVPPYDIFLAYAKPTRKGDGLRVKVTIYGIRSGVWWKQLNEHQSCYGGWGLCEQGYTCIDPALAARAAYDLMTSVMVECLPAGETIWLGHAAHAATAEQTSAGASSSRASVTDA